nr:uncharacterized protein LOC108124628 [Drosophila bipectinata]
MMGFKLRLVGLVLLFAGTLKAQETTAAATTATVAGATGTEKVSSGTEVTTAAGGVTGAENGVTNRTTVSPSGGTENITSTDHLHEDPHAAQTHHDNGGDPYVSPGKHRPGPRHVRAHDGFHNLKKEKHWATWNDAFTTPALKKITPEVTIHP